jgi:hypothetical protein
MNNNTPDRIRLHQFYMWMATPTGLFSLRTVLNEQRDVELLHIMQESTDKQARSVAWAEYGRRHGLANIEFKMEGVEVLDINIKDLVFTSTLAAA